MENKPTVARSAHAELLTRRAKLDQKKCDCESMASNSAAKLAGLEQAHSILEKRYLTDEASLSQVSASRQELDICRAELTEAKRLAGLAAEAIQEIDAQIQQTKQAMAAAAREFCTEQRSAAIARIKADATLKKNLIAAMAANVGTGGQFTFQTATFAAQFIRQLLPEISKDEVREAAEKFQKDNDLN